MNDNLCSVCFNEFTNEVKTNCQHQFCYDCLNTWFYKNKKSCPICRTDINFIINKNEKIKLLFIENKINTITEVPINNSPVLNSNQIIVYKYQYHFLRIFSAILILISGGLIYVIIN